MWGKLMACDPEALRERIVNEQANNALVAALFLTMTIPWFCDPPASVEDVAFAVTILLVSLCFQFLSLGSSLNIMGAANKLTVEDTVKLVKHLWGPRAGHLSVGNLAFLFGHLSWISTLAAALYAGIRTFSSVVVTSTAIAVGVIILLSYATSFGSGPSWQACHDPSNLHLSGPQVI